ncbi:MAG: extracellular matrix/biofilm biosynthesis regulator RemA family protein [Armatimonadota bacterium]|jgi:regulator of extracellular matrix RemA (YlzA/DUF370 family)
MSVGFGNAVVKERIIAIVSSDSAPVRRVIQEARRTGRLIDATQGHRTRSVIFADSGQIIVSGLARETLTKRLGQPGPVHDSPDEGAQDA